MNNYFGEIAALGTALCWSFGSVFFTISSRMIGHNVVNRQRLFVGFVLLLLTHLLVTGKLIPEQLTLDTLIWFSASGIIGFVIGDTLLFKSFVLVGPRMSMLMMSLVPILSTIIAWIFLKEVLTFTDIMAIIITLIGISIVIIAKDNSTIQTQAEKNKYLLGLICGVGGAIGQAIGLIFSKQGLIISNILPLAGNIIRIFAAVITIWLLTLINGEFQTTIKAISNKKASGAMLGGAVLGPFLGVWLSLIAVKYAYVGIASTLMALPPIILIPVSHWVFKEKITFAAVLGTVIAVSGVTLIFLL